VNSVNKDLGGTCGKIERFCSGGKPERLEENHENLSMGNRTPDYNLSSKFPANYFRMLLSREFLQHVTARCTA
jgi:hypothetical protein